MPSWAAIIPLGLGVLGIAPSRGVLYQMGLKVRYGDLPRMTTANTEAGTTLFYIQTSKSDLGID